MVIGGVSFPVVRLELDGGKLVMTYALTGPRAGAAGHTTVYGPDGVGCWQGGYKVLPPVPDGETWFVSYALQVVSVETWDTTEVVGEGPPGP